MLQRLRNLIMETILLASEEKIYQKYEHTSKMFQSEKLSYSLKKNQRRAFQAFQNIYKPIIYRKQLANIVRSCKISYNLPKLKPDKLQTSDIS